MFHRLVYEIRANACTTHIEHCTQTLAKEWENKEYIPHRILDTQSTHTERTNSVQTEIASCLNWFGERVTIVIATTHIVRHTHTHTQNGYAEFLFIIHLLCRYWKKKPQKSQLLFLHFCFRLLGVCVVTFLSFISGLLVFCSWTLSRGRANVHWMSVWAHSFIHITTFRTCNLITDEKFGHRNSKACPHRKICYWIALDWTDYCRILEWMEMVVISVRA